ncbi:ribose-phosphate pyrophosphokinase isoform C [Chlorella sorokiniana]|uniref:Ribose-phosphate pyrophosphokinase isoform C n=1 Tax=Chlorella sorokiniana TaxID=3076 RepID=A0A2P6TNF4_CHLSO|nr:ribose-phosphate pyrophosphokinase isoform C [Chlorella sorokiniana]|eukprot:PRW50864.1 ribose-phosphate pyrophosphokinase isoform C [Chlorella sorokiniana]
MSNHILLKPSAVSGHDPETSDYRITAPNVGAMEVPEELKRDCLLFYYPDCEQLARRVAECSEGKVELAEITWNEGKVELAEITWNEGKVELAEITWKRFADGFPNLFVKDAIRIRNRHVAFLASFHKPSVIFEQISIIYQLPRLFVGSFTLVLPYFPTGTAERVEAEGDVATAFTLARIISNIPLARGGPASVVIFDIHALQERFYFGDQVLPLFESGIPLLRERLRQLPDASNITIAYPDEGAWKRFHYQFGDYPEVICTKVRDGDKRIVRLKEGTARGRHVVIVDDLVQSGGTLIECQKLLATQGAAHVSAYVTHGVFPKESWRRFEGEGSNGAADGFKYFWITDSCPATVEAVTDRAPFEVLSLAQPIAAALQI